MEKGYSQQSQLNSGNSNNDYDLTIKKDSVLYDFSTERDNKISYLFEYSKFLKEKKIIDNKIQNWQNENIFSTSNVNLENLFKIVTNKIFRLFQNNSKL